MKISEEISKKEYREIQRFNYFVKQNNGKWILGGGICGITIAMINIISSGKVSVGAIVFICFPFVAALLSLLRINALSDKLYEKDINKWTIEITDDYIAAKPDNMKQTIKIKSDDWYRAYELKSVILLYFNKNQFFTLCKKEFSKEELMEVKGMIYDKIGSAFKVRTQK